MRRILLTGAGPHGFVGQNLAPALKERYEVFTPSRRELNLCDYDLLARYIADNQIDTVVHGALQSILRTGPEDIMLHDLQMFYNIEKLSGELDRVLYFGPGLGLWFRRGV